MRRNVIIACVYNYNPQESNNNFDNMIKFYIRKRQGLWNEVMECHDTFSSSHCTLVAIIKTNCLLSLICYNIATDG